MDDFGAEHALSAAPPQARTAPPGPLPRTADARARATEAEAAAEAEAEDERAQRREQVLFERERLNARRRAQRAASGGGRAVGTPAVVARPHGEEFEAGWWSVEQAVRAPAPRSGGAALPAVPAAPRPDAAAPTVTVPVSVPMTVPADLWRGEGGYSLDLDLPGIDPASVVVSAAGNVLTVSAERRGQRVQGRAAVLLERPVGTVTRQVRLPEDVDAGTASVGYRDGVLSVSLPVSLPVSAAVSGAASAAVSAAESAAATGAGEDAEQDAGASAGPGDGGRAAEHVIDLSGGAAVEQGAPGPSGR